MKIKAKILPIPSSNIDTDQIIPARYLTGISKTGLGDKLFEDVPNSPIANKEYEGAGVVVTKENFGCGSSREHAVWALTDRGFKAVIAESFARIFEENCYNNAVVPVVLDKEAVAFILDNPKDEIEIDVNSQTVSFKGKNYDFGLDPLKKEFILKGGFMNFLDAKVPEIKKWAKERVS